PVENLSLDVAHGDSADLTPTVYAIETTEAILKVKWLANRDRVAENFDGVSKIVRVNKVVHPPLAYLFRRPAEILQNCSIEDSGSAIRRKLGKEARHVVQQRARIKFSCPQGLLRSLAILNVYTGSVPFDDVIGFIPQRIGADQEPSIRTVETA